MFRLSYIACLCRDGQDQYQTRHRETAFRTYTECEAERWWENSNVWEFRTGSKFGLHAVSQPVQVRT